MACAVCAFGHMREKGGQHRMVLKPWEKMSPSRQHVDRGLGQCLKLNSKELNEVILKA